MRIKNIAIAVSLLLGASAFAQHNEEVTIEGAYRPKVNKVDKILMQPEKPQQSFEMPSTEVRVLDIEHRFPLELEKLNALNYNGKSDQMPKPAKNFLMAGFGSRISPVFLYKHNSNLTKNLGLGVGIKHYSSWQNMEDYPPSSFMNNAFEIGLTSNKNDLKTGYNVYYKNDTYHYYGTNIADLPTGVSVDKAAPLQVYNTIGTHFGLASTTTRNGEFVHQLGLDYHYLFGKLDGHGTEQFASLNYDLGYADSWWGKKNHPQKLGLSLDARFDFTEFAGKKDDTRLIFKVNPYFEMKDDFYRLHLGVRLDGATQFVSSNQLLTVHPDVKGSLLVLDNSLEFYAGLDGGRKLFTYSDLIEKNPFVATRLDMEVTTVRLGFEGGIRTNIMNTMDVHVGVRYRHTDNDLFFRQCLHASVGIPYNSFDVIYDETKQVSVLGNIRWLVTDEMTLDAGMAYNNYDPATEQHAWYRPTIEGDLKLSYCLGDRWNFNTSLLYQGGRWAQENTTSVKMKDVIDLGIGFDYHVNDQLTVFAKLDNVAHQKYQLYYDYPVSGIQFFAGLKMRF